MTIIVYDGYTLATDTGYIQKGTHTVHPVEKAWKVQLSGIPCIIAGTGSAEVITKFREYVKAQGELKALGGFARSLGASIKIPTMLIVVTPEEVIYSEDMFETVLTTKAACAFGHGQDIAYGALHMGASAREAVLAAIRFSPYCNGDVNEYSVKED